MYCVLYCTRMFCTYLPSILTPAIDRHPIRRLGSVEESRDRKEFSFFLDTFGDEGGAGRDLAVSSLCAAGIEGRGEGGALCRKSRKFPDIGRKRGGKRETFFFLSSKEGRRRISRRMRGLVFAPHDRGYFFSLRSRHWFLNRPKVRVERCKLSMQCLVIFLLAQNVLHSKKHYILLCHRLKYSHSPSSWKLQKSSPSFFA